MNSEREAILRAVEILNNRLAAGRCDAERAAFAADYDGMVLTQDTLCDYARRTLVDAMVDVIAAFMDAGSDTTPDYVETRSDLRKAIGEVLDEQYHALHEEVRERAAEAQTAYGRAEIAADAAYDDARAA